MRNWWPPKFGDKLRRLAGTNPSDDKLVHVIAVMEDDGEMFAIVKEWSSSRQRWIREVISEIQAFTGLYRPNGTPRKYR